ncbi:VPLPA-CTERM sorting domain-containing protein [Rhodovulum steppense]|nr:VPLPA-CTERM sorting domain-containing protein [Rhodovulum steppense]
MKAISATLSAVALMATVSAAGAATVQETINLRAGSAQDTDGKVGNQSVHTFETAGGLGLTVTGHLLTGSYGIGSLEQIGQWDNGLGVLNDDEKSCRWLSCTNTDEHFVDGTGKNEVVKFLFDKMVTLVSVTFSYVDQSDKFSFGLLTDSGYTHISDGQTIGNWFYETYTFQQTWTSDLFGIGAINDKTQFKIKSITVAYDTPEVVPLPAAGWLLLGGLGGLAALKRRRKAVA